MPKTGENIYKRKDGRWEARFISGRKPDGRAKYTSVYARTYAAAKAKLEERKRMVVSPQAVNCRLTVAELFAWYLAQAEIKPSTRARYVFLIDHHILPYLGSVFVPALTAAQLTDFLNQKKQNGRLRGGGLSAKSVRDIGVLIKAALRLASAEYHFYCDALNAKLPAAKQRKIEPFSSGELAQLGKALLPSGNHTNVASITIDGADFYQPDYTTSTDTHGTIYDYYIELNEETAEGTTVTAHFTKSASAAANCVISRVPVVANPPQAQQIIWGQRADDYTATVNEGTALASFSTSFSVPSRHTAWSDSISGSNHS